MNADLVLGGAEAVRATKKRKRLADEFEDAGTTPEQLVQHQIIANEAAIELRQAVEDALNDDYREQSIDAPDDAHYQPAHIVTSRLAELCT
jgi:hypothetical protein